MSIPEQQMEQIFEAYEYHHEQYLKELNSIVESVKYLKNEWQDNHDMQCSINTEHENYKGSSEESCFKNHESIKLRCEIIQNQLKELKFFKERETTRDYDKQTIAESEKIKTNEAFKNEVTL